MSERTRIGPMIRLPSGTYLDLREVAAIQKPTVHSTHVHLRGDGERKVLYLPGDDYGVLAQAMGAYYFEGIEVKEKNG